MRDVGPALGLEPGATADECIAAIDALRARAAAPKVEHVGHAPGTPYALTRMVDGATAIEPGDVLPFDPANPPAGFSGFVEGVHYRRAG